MPNIYRLAADEIFLSRDLTESEMDDTGFTNETLFQNQNKLILSDYVSGKLTAQKNLSIYVGKIISTKHSEGLVEKFLNLSFFQRKKPSFSFNLPTVDHISEVSLLDILGKLPRPLLRGGTTRVPRHFIFPVDLTAKGDALNLFS